MNLKSLTEYYFLKITPILLVFNLLANDALTQSEVYVAFFLYFVYAQIISGIRLIQLKLIQRKDFFKVFIPFWTAKYHDELHFGIKNKP